MSDIETKTIEEKILLCKYETTIQLLNLYLTEWMHRDTLIWKHVYQYFYAILIITMLPNITGFLNINLPHISQVVFPIIGIVASFLFLYVCFGYAKRLEVVGNIYNDIIQTLPPQFQRKKLEQIKNGKHFNFRISKVIIIIMFIFLLTTSLIMICDFFF